MNGLTGALLFALLLYLSETNKPVCFVVCALLAVAMIAGVL